VSKLLFLGGTCGNNNWREGFTRRLLDGGVAEQAVFNPMVPEWNDAAQAAEEKAKAECSHLLFYLADPMNGGTSAYSMVEATMALYDRPDVTVLVFDSAGMEGHALKALQQTQKVLQARFPGAKILGVDEALEVLVRELR
jgi:hypothetical protein